MADFKLAIPSIIANEGGYVNDPDDAGGETMYGITRKNFPNWRGWVVVDSHKRDADFPKCLLHIPELLELAQYFYQEHFWLPIRGTEIINNEVAKDLLDKAVNMGISQAVKLCQESLDVPITGKMDNTTLNTLNANNPYA
jgi:lysozyme family protein